MFGAILGPFSSAAAMQAAAQQHQFQQMALDMQRQQMKVLDWEPIPARRTKCDSCGSREFREHHGQSVCAYCRGVA